MTAAITRSSPAQRVSVLLFDDRRQVRAAMAQLVSGMPGVEFVECVARAPELLDRYRRRPADVVLVGTQRAVPGGVEAIRTLVASAPTARVIAFGSGDDTRTAVAAINAGARGFLRWDTRGPDLQMGVLAVVADGTPSSNGNGRSPDPLPDPLTTRELQVLRGMARGLPNAEIGRELYLSEDTIKSHGRTLFKKLEARDRAAAVAAGFRTGLLS